MYCTVCFRSTECTLKRRKIHSLNLFQALSDFDQSPIPRSILFFPFCESFQSSLASERSQNITAGRLTKSGLGHRKSRKNRTAILDFSMRWTQKTSGPESQKLFSFFMVNSNGKKRERRERIILRWFPTTLSLTGLIRHSLILFS